MRDGSLQAAQKQEWTRTPPTTFGHWWWWDGDEDHLPVVLDLNISILGQAYAPGGAHPYEDDTPVDLFGGWWAPLTPPALPRDTLE